MLSCLDDCYGGKDVLYIWFLDFSMNERYYLLQNFGIYQNKKDGKKELISVSYQIKYYFQRIFSGKKSSSFYLSKEFSISKNDIDYYLHSVL